MRRRRRISCGLTGQYSVSQRRAFTREWAELAYWFQPLSRAAAQQPLLGDELHKAIVNIDMTDIGGSGGLPSYVSHRYMHQKPVWEVHKLWDNLTKELMR